MEKALYGPKPSILEQSHIRLNTIITNDRNLIGGLCAIND